MGEIRLSNGMVAKVDDADLEWLSRWNWHSMGEGRKRYAGRLERRGSGVRVFISMHRALMGFPEGKQVDHINGDSLDNRRGNLRICDHFGQHRNARKSARGRSPYRGVAWMKNMGRWQVRITVTGKKLFLGYTATDEEGARIYDEAARKHHGEFACVNFPRPGEQGALTRAA